MPHSLGNIGATSVFLYKGIMCFDSVAYLAFIPTAEWKAGKGPNVSLLWSAETDWEVHHLHMLLQQPSLCCQTRLGFIPKYPSPNLISGRTCRIKYVSLAFICCKKASKGQWMTAKLIISFSEWRSGSVTAALLVLAYIFMHNYSAHPEVTKIHRMNKIPLEPSTSIDMQTFFFFFFDWLTEGDTWVRMTLDFVVFF